VRVSSFSNSRLSCAVSCAVTFYIISDSLFLPPDIEKPVDTVSASSPKVAFTGLSACSNPVLGHLGAWFSQVSNSTTFSVGFTDQIPLRRDRRCRRSPLVFNQ
jgi:hypothetical protein